MLVSSIMITQRKANSWSELLTSLPPWIPSMICMIGWFPRHVSNPAQNGSAEPVIVTKKVIKWTPFFLPTAIEFADG